MWSRVMTFLKYLINASLKFKWKNDSNNFTADFIKTYVEIVWKTISMSWAHLKSTHNSRDTPKDGTHLDHRVPYKSGEDDIVQVSEGVEI